LALKKLLLILSILLIATGAWGADNRAIQSGNLPVTDTFGADTTGAFEDLEDYSNQTGIAFVEGGGSADTITDSNSQFVAEGFAAGDTIEVSGSTSNDGFYLINAVSTGTITLESVCDLADEAAGDTVTIQEWPTVYAVNTLTYGTAKAADTRNSHPVYDGGAQAFFDWSDAGHGNIIMVFEVSGVIDASNDIVRLDGGSVSIYGQTAPSPGVFFETLRIYALSDNIVIQHIASSGTDSRAEGIFTAAVYSDASSNTENIIFDHLTAIWSSDDTMSAGSQHSSYTAKNVIFSNNIMAEPVYYDGDSGLSGGMVGDQTENVLVYKNFYTGNHHRNPLIAGYSSGTGAQAAIVNNYVYNYYSFAMEFINSSSSPVQVTASWDGNVVELGPSDDYNNMPNDFLRISYDPHVDTEIWMEDNCWGDGTTCQSDEDDYDGVFFQNTTGTVADFKTAYVVADPPLVYGFTADAPGTVKAAVLASAGSRPMDRDEEVARLVNEAQTGGGITDTATADFASVGTWYGAIEDTRDVGTGMTADNYTNLSDPYGDSNADGRVNFYDNFLDGLTDGVETPYTPPPGQDVTPTDVTFWWRAEALDFSATNGTDDYSPSDDIAAASDSVTVNAAAKYLGTNGLDVADGGKYVTLTPTAGDMLSYVEGRFGFWLRVTTWEAGVALFRLSKDGDNDLVLWTSGTDELYLKWEGGGVIADHNLTSDANIGTGTWYFIEIAWKQSTPYRQIFVNGSAPTQNNDSAAIAAWTDGDDAEYLYLGAIGGTTVDVHMDNFMGSDDSTRDFYTDEWNGTDYADLTSYPTFEPGPTIDSASCPATTYSTPGTITVTLTMSEDTYVTSAPSFVVESGETDATCGYTGGSGSTSLEFECTLIAGMRTLDLDFSSASVALNGGSLDDVGGEDATLTLPASIDNETIIAVPANWKIPTDHADYATLLAAHGYLIGNDGIEVLDNANITITDEDGTSGNLITIYLRASYSGTLDLNSNDYIQVFAHPSATVSNSGGTDVVVKKFNGAAGL